MNRIDSFTGNDANAAIEIRADERGSGGASHYYLVEWRDTAGYPPLAEMRFQDGAIQEVGHNGITDEALIAILIDRLRGFQSGPFSCRQNALALTKLEEAMHWLNDRTRDRVKRGVEGRSAA